VTRIHSFTPVADERARILILGSMPGSASLAAGQYYAHKQNAFWRIMAELLAFDYGIAYADKIAMLRSAHIALWDVLHSCKRIGSLDTMIEAETQLANDFVSFFHRHRAITHIYFNGSKAEACFKQLVMPNIECDTFHYQRLPSTSPANATIPFMKKLEAWRAILKPLHDESIPHSIHGVALKKEYRLR
jgi:TDG/mug DNA glycosylase family protein